MITFLENPHIPVWPPLIVLQQSASCCIIVHMNIRKFFQSLTLTLFVFGFAGWIYIAENAVFHPQTLHLHLTHFAPWPHNYAGYF